MARDNQSIPSGYRPGSPRSRFVSSILSVTIIILVVLAALYQTQIAPQLEQADNPVTFDVSGENEDAGGEEAESEDEEEAADEAEPEPDPEPEAVEDVPEDPVEPVETPVVTQKPAYSFTKLSREDFAAADIGAMKKPAKPSSGGGSGGPAYGPGEGPGGVVLYNADWYRRPTDAQLGGYLPPDAPRAGWGMIACQTIEDYRVENCQIMGESPRGSGFGRAVLNAAWQFRVLPPRVNGEPQIGTWVRIRIDYGTRPG